MLVISRKVDESVRVGDAVVKVLGYGNGKVKLGIEAPEDVPILRSELVTAPTPGDQSNE